MNKEIICRICSQVLCSPITYHCCYTSICRSCLKNVESKDETIQDSCPFCHKRIEETFQPTSNIFLLEFIESMRKDEKIRIIDCNCCEKKLSYKEAFMCTDCNNNLFCQDCWTALHNLGKYKSHEKKQLIQEIDSQVIDILKEMTCNYHNKEKVEYICLKDLKALCNKCCISHKKSCKLNKIFPFKEVYKDLKNQLCLEKEKILHYQSIMETTCQNFLGKLESININYIKEKQEIENQFVFLHEILKYKQKEILFNYENSFNKRKNNLEKEILELQDIIVSANHMKQMIEFSLDCQGSTFFESTKYLAYKIERIIHSITSKKQFPDFSMPILNIEECKKCLYNLNISEKSECLYLQSNQIKSPSKFQPLLSAGTPQKKRLNGPKIFFSMSNDTKMDTILTERDKTQINISIDKGYLHAPSEERDISCRDSDYTNTPATTSREFQNSSLTMTLPKNSKYKIKAPRTSLHIEDRTDFDFHLTNSFSHPKSTRASSFIGYDFLRTTSESQVVENNGRPLTAHIKTMSVVLQNQSPLLCSNVEYMAELQKNPLLKRNFTEVGQTATSIFVYVVWSHILEQENIVYEVEYGVGAKVQGTEQFRSAFKGSRNMFIINDLMPKTTYRLRVRPILLNRNKNSTITVNQHQEETCGEWSNILSVNTKEPQKIDPSSLGHHAKIVFKGKDTFVEFNKSGIITALDAYSYGRTAWQVELKQQSAHQTTDDSNSSIKIGVTNKMGKIFYVFGSIVNYGLQKESTKINVLLDLESRSLTIYSPANPRGETIYNLPPGPLYPAFQNKTNKNSTFSLRMLTRFDLSSDQIEKITFFNN